MTILNQEQLLQIRRELCSQDHCLRCNISILDASKRFIWEYCNRTQKHEYVNCIIVCKSCYDDKKGMWHWWNELEPQDILYAVKDNACVSVVVR